MGDENQILEPEDTMSEQGDKTPQEQTQEETPVAIKNKAYDLMLGKEIADIHGGASTVNGKTVDPYTAKQGDPVRNQATPIGAIRAQIAALEARIKALEEKN